MAEFIFEDPWSDPEERRRRVEEALQGWDREALLEGLEAFRRRRGKRGSRVDRASVEAFLFWLEREGRRWPALEAGDVKGFLRELLVRGNPLSSVPKPYRDKSLVRVLASLRLFARFLDWAGVGWPTHVEWPQNVLNPVRHDLALPEEAYRRLLESIPTFPVAHQRPLLAVVVPLMGEVGLGYRELCALWRQDYLGDRLLVRGKVREVPLSPEAQKAVEEWLPLRDYLAGLHPIPYPHLLLRTARGKGRGKPLSPLALRLLLEDLFHHAGLGGIKQIMRALQYRAVRRFFQRGFPKEKVAYFVGVKRIAQGWE